MGYITKQEFSTELAEEFNGVKKDVGDKQALATSDKTDLVSAINEAFQFANDGKTDIASVVGSPATAGNTFAQLKTHIQDSKNTLATNLTNAGQTSTGSETLKSLVDKVANVQSGISGEAITTGLFKETISKGDAIAIRTKYEGIAGFDIQPSVYQGRGEAMAFSPDGNYFAATLSMHPFIAIYKKSGNAFYKLANPDVLPADGTARTVCWHPDGDHLYYGNGVYKRSGDTFTKLADASLGGLQSVYAITSFYCKVRKWLIIQYPFSVEVYIRTGDTYAKNPNISINNTGGYATLSLSDDGEWLVGGGSYGGSSNYATLHIYRWNGTTYVRQGDPAVMPDSGILSSAFSPDNQHMVLGTSGSQYKGDKYVYIYKIINGNFTRLVNASYRDYQAVGVAYSPDSNMLVTTGLSGSATTGAADRLRIFSRSGDTYSSFPNPTAYPSGTMGGVTYSPDGKFLALIFNQLVHLYLVDFGVYKSSNLASEALNGALGYAKESGTAGQTKQISLVWR